MEDSKAQTDELLAKCLTSELQFGEFQQFRDLALLPLYWPDTDGPQYLTLKRALENGLIRISEVSHGGSVPELKVVNNAEVPVLVVDGEELIGAKQNRVLNTTILIKAKSETVVPVSCTEQGRWAYTSAEFSSSEVVMPRATRSVKLESVSASLSAGRRYRSDQMAVWGMIDHVSRRASVRSPTGALKDVYESRSDDLDAYLKAFRCEPSQNGVLVFLNGKVVGIECVSSAQAYQEIHEKILTSYALDAILQGKQSRQEPEPKPSTEQARAFLPAKKYKSIGHGWDYRLEGDKLIGSALMHENVAIHLAVFRTDTPTTEAHRQESPGRRSTWRRVFGG